MSKGKRRSGPAFGTETGTRAGPAEPLSLQDELERRRGVPKTPQGWWTLGLTVMAILMGIALWLRYS
jgi:hypothetical protein